MIYSSRFRRGMNVSRLVNLVRRSCAVDESETCGLRAEMHRESLRAELVSPTV